MIANAELSLSDSFSLSKSGGGGSSQMGITVRQFVNELESPSFVFLPLFGQETILHIHTLLRAAVQAKTNLRSFLVEPVDHKVSGIFAQLRDWFSITGLNHSEENGEEIKKTLNHLELASDQLSKLFDVKG